MMQWFYPDRGDFIGFVGNFSSWSFLRSCRKYWPQGLGLPMVGAALPPMLAEVAMSDQINFWNAGFKAIMVSDTAYFRNPHYHTDSDTWEKLDYVKMAQLAQSLAVLLEKAE